MTFAPKTVLLCLGLCLGLAAPAAAQRTFDDAGAAALQTLVDDGLTPYLARSAREGYGLTVGGATVVTPKDRYFEVRIPGVTVTSRSQSQLRIGTVVMNVSPGKRADEYLASVAFPQKISLYNHAGKLLGDINLGRQRFSAAYTVSLGTFTRIEAEYTGLGATGTPDEPFDFTVASLKGVLDMKQESDGTWSGPHSFEMRDVKLATPAKADTGAAVIALKRSVSNGVYTGVDLARNTALNEKAEALLKDNVSPQPADLQPLIGDLLNDGLLPFKSFRNRLDIEGLSVKIDPVAGAADDSGRSLDVKKFGTLVELLGTQEEKGTMTLQFRVEDADAKNPLAAPPVFEYIPRNANVEIYGSNLPIRKISGVIAGIIGTAFDNLVNTVDVADYGLRLQQQYMQGAQSLLPLLSLPQALKEAGSSLSIRNTYAHAPEISMKVEGNIGADPLTPVPATGEVTVTLEGLDELVLRLQSEKSRAARRAAGGLTLLQMLGKQPAVSAARRSERQYVLQLTPEGKTLLNGMDSGMAMGLAGQSLPQFLQAAPSGSTPRADMRPKPRGSNDVPR